MDIARVTIKAAPLFITPTHTGCQVSSSVITMGDDVAFVSIKRNSSNSSEVSATSPVGMESAPVVDSGTIVSEREPDGHSRFRFENKGALVNDLAFLANMPEVADVTFLVGDEKHPVCGVRAILAARSRVFRKMLFPEKDPLVPGSGNQLEKKMSRMKISTSQMDGTSGKCYLVPDFEHLEFKQLIHYLHTGTCTLQAQILPGLMNAADHFGVDELKKACIGFVDSCISTDTVCPLLNIAERYIQYKSTKLLVRKVLEFIDKRGEEVLNLPTFATLPGHVVSLILSREELRASELTKFNAAHTWAVRHSKKEPEISVRDAIQPLVSCVAYHMIPAHKLMKEIKPLNLVPDEMIMIALAYHADPTSVDVNKMSPRVKKAGSGGEESPQKGESEV
eukprot:m.49028 g.49028  ORF g.49028 m.49028 type:complete len:393 (+) comp33955_c0_seq4:991-2169(+)